MADGKESSAFAGPLHLLAAAMEWAVLAPQHPYMSCALFVVIIWLYYALAEASRAAGLDQLYCGRGYECDVPPSARCACAASFGAAVYALLYVPWSSMWLALSCRARSLWKQCPAMREQLLRRASDWAPVVRELSARLAQGGQAALRGAVSAAPGVFAAAWRAVDGRAVWAAASYGGALAGAVLRLAAVSATRMVRALQGVIMRRITARKKAPEQPGPPPLPALDAPAWAPPPLGGAAAAACSVTCGAGEEVTAAAEAARASLQLVWAGTREHLAFGESEERSRVCTARFQFLRGSSASNNGALWMQFSDRVFVYMEQVQRAGIAQQARLAFHGLVRLYYEERESLPRASLQWSHLRALLLLQHGAFVEAQVQHAVQLRGSPLMKALRSAAAARLGYIRVEWDGAAPRHRPGAPCGVYRRAFAAHRGQPVWEAEAGESALRFAGGEFHLVDRAGHILAGGQRGSALPLRPGGRVCWTCGGGALCLSVLDAKISLPDPVADVLSRAYGALKRVEAADRALRKVQCARSLTWARRVVLDKKQEVICANVGMLGDGELRRLREQRDAARADAHEHQVDLVNALDDPCIADLFGQLHDFDRLEHDLAQLPGAAGSGDVDDSELGPAVAAAQRALEASGERQRAYEKAVAGAQARTDAAVRGGGAERIAQAAGAEVELRARAAPLTAHEQAEREAAVAHTLRALSAAIRCLEQLRAQRQEAEEVAAELAEGCKEAGSFYERVEAMALPGRKRAAQDDYEEWLCMKGTVAPDVWKRKEAELRRRYEEAESSEPDSPTQLGRRAATLRVRADREFDPEKRKRLVEQSEAVLLRVHVLRKARAADSARILELARAHFPECVGDIGQGALSGLLRTKRPAALRLLLAGGSMSDYAIIGDPLAASIRHTVHRAACGEGTVVIKRIGLKDDTGDALRVFARGITMMDAAGDVAATVRCVFLDDNGTQGCVVMDNYPCNLANWAADSDPSLSAVSVLRMAQHVIECFVRLHSASREFPEGIIHGDVTPQNVVVDDAGRPRLIDFEMARPDSDALLQSTMLQQGMTAGFTAPELCDARGNRDSDTRTTKMTDIYGLGATLAHVLKEGCVQAAAGDCIKPLQALCAKMTAGSPEQRPSADQAAQTVAGVIEQYLRDSQSELDRREREVDAERHRVEAKKKRVLADSTNVAAEKDALRRGAEELAKRAAAQVASIRDEQDRLQRENEERKRRLAEDAQANRREQELLKNEGAKLSRTKAELSEERKKLDTRHGEVTSTLDDIKKLKAALHDPPAHWSLGRGPSQGWGAVAVPAGSGVFAALRDSLRTNPAGLNAGRDVIERGKYTKLALKVAWRIENSALWRQYAVARDLVREQIKRKQLPIMKLEIRRETAETLGPIGTALPGPLQHTGGMNELRLFHGLRPEALLNMLLDGLNERFAGLNGTLFGGGTYYAEDAGKCDQYVLGHEFQEKPEWQDIERRLYRDGVSHPGGRVYYVLVCRVICGAYAVTKDSETQVDTGKPVFATAAKRELAFTASGGHYCSLLAELGQKILRYREFIVFRGQRVYPEYLLAYHRE
eukprot:TRINITY_DN15499_c0_g1_i1.p1 TRINITY_DN15499_c0_g1~~TRINITY_DN15499_c0_g1_i1.p1  ORF type:complete len:1592 (+),score=390.03 TRINITY_DN15499_c0_g1_i1:94-4776(+)